MSFSPPFHSIGLYFSQTGKAARRSLGGTLFYLFVALTLVCTQQEAMLHALEHVKEQLAQHQDKDKNPAETKQCLKCLALAPMLGALPSVLPDFPLTRHDVELSSLPPDISYSLIGEFPFLARAPPFLR